MIKSRFVIFAAILFFMAVVSHVNVSASTAHSTFSVVPQAAPAARLHHPAWNQNRFVNHQRMAQQSNRVLMHRLQQFYNQQHPIILNTYQPPNNVGRYPIDPQLNQTFRNIISQSFREDSFSQTLPFNPTFVDFVLNNTYFYFARPRTPGNYYIGTYTNRSAFSYIHVSIRGIAPDCFTFVAIHELGHALGLGETLADLFAEEFTVRSISIRPDENLAYNSTFDRTLLNLVGPHLFWDAAFRSNTAYGTLWDAHFSHFLTHNEIQIVRGIFLATIPGTSQYRPSLARAFEQYTGVTLEQASMRFHSDFLLITGQLPGQSPCRESIELFRGLITSYLHFARIHDLASSYSVWEFALESHRQRYRRASISG